MIPIKVSSYEDFQEYLSAQKVKVDRQITEEILSAFSLECQCECHNSSIRGEPDCMCDCNN